MKTPEQLKGAVRNIAKEKNLSAQAVLQTFMFERIIERLSVSQYQNIFILKGGLLISALLGIDERTTMDMDATVKGLPMNEIAVQEAILDILGQPVDDGICFEMISLDNIREDDEYENFRASIVAYYGRMSIPMKIDITTGDAITPREIQFLYPLTFEDRRVPVMAYPQETVIAEKYETIIRRNVATTRSRDFYDLHLLFRLYQQNANWQLLRQAITNTAKKRESEQELRNAKNIIRAIEKSTALRDSWKRYQRQNVYARGIEFEDTVETLEFLTEKLGL